MNKPLHTHGLWHVGQRTGPNNGSLSIEHDCEEGGPIEIAQVLAESEEQEANAYLIASAPELLEALQHLAGEINLSKLNVRKDFILMNAHACALKIIHKAKGE